MNKVDIQNCLNILSTGILTTYYNFGLLCFTLWFLYTAEHTNIFNGVLGILQFSAGLCVNSGEVDLGKYL